MRYVSSSAAFCAAFAVLTMCRSACVEDMSNIGGNTGLPNRVSCFCSFGSLLERGEVVDTVDGCGAPNGAIKPTNGVAPVLNPGNLGSNPGGYPFLGELK